MRKINKSSNARQSHKRHFNPTNNLNCSRRTRAPNLLCQVHTRGVWGHERRIVFSTPGVDCECVLRQCFENVFWECVLNLYLGNFPPPGWTSALLRLHFLKNKTRSQNTFSKHYFKPLVPVQAPQGVAEIVENFCTSRLLVHDRTPHTKWCGTMQAGAILHFLLIR